VRRLLSSDSRFPRPFRVGVQLRFLRSDIEDWVANGGSAPKVEVRSAGGRTETRRLPVGSAPTIRRDGGRQILTGYAAVFFDGTPGTQFELAPGLVERYGATAFDADIGDGVDVVATWNHNLDNLLGRRASGTFRLSVDARGLRYELDLPNTVIGNQVAELAARGDITGSSLQFITRDSREFQENGVTVRELLDLELIECGPVWMPAYKAASAGLSNAGIGAGATTGNRSKAKADRDRIAIELALMDAEMADEQPPRRVPTRGRPGATMHGDIAEINRVIRDGYAATPRAY
jgi:HK97 family phage prohead protease